MVTKAFSLDQLGWDHLRALLEAARGGSLAAAAKKLGVDQSTVSRRLAQVEFSAGEALFRRCRTGLVLTALGREVFIRVERMEAALHEIQGLTAQGQSVNGRVTVASMEGVGSLLIARAVKGLKERHPLVQVNLVTTSSYVDVAKREADIFVSFFEPSSASLITQKIADVPFYLYASPAFLERRPVPNAQALADEEFIGYIDDPAYLPSARWMDGIVLNPTFGFRATSMFSQMYAAQEGLGIVMLPSYANAESMGLKKVIEERCTEVPLFISVQHDLQYLPHIRATFEALAAYLGSRIPR
ncbi:LysR family transcriptional regulator [Burkholderia sp. SFA1]|uniref:LysR family transcriptional regulator n=1 Tax=Caballeronia cordobensis TaxID=1353886 RepID=A0A158GT73_CABCO|nr:MULTISPECIES: LysR family transcriptional regulator [Caballeronia]MCE4573746.1 LysR family transcriptional regulator [Caballeronia sp. CLC5]BBQ00591.1 LysR family transcriptional regulator [Burkholderia sp. SFA1]SAL35242.1 LysR family transcriptional regulator [Caballeronia cordobensis]